MMIIQSFNGLKVEGGYPSFKGLNLEGDYPRFKGLKVEGDYLSFKGLRLKVKVEEKSCWWLKELLMSEVFICQ